MFTVTLKHIAICTYIAMAAAIILLGYVSWRQAILIDAQKAEINNLCIAGRFDCEGIK